MRLLPFTGCFLVSAAMLTAADAIAQTVPQSVAITQQQVQNLEIKVAPVQPASTEAIAVLPGTVIPPVNSRHVAVAPFAGTVTELHVLPGRRVIKGAALATISSRELLETQSQLAQSEAELQLAQAIARRKRTLADKNFQNPTVADEAEAQVAKVEAVIAQHRRALTLHGIEAAADGQYTIPAPLDGTVVETSVMPGDKVEAMGAAVSLDTSSELWVEIQVPANVLPQVKPGDIVQIANGPEGRVVSIGSTLDRLTRSATMYAAVPANSGLISGQMVSVGLVRAAETGAFNVPAIAVARIADRHAIFVRNETGFTVTPVELRGKSTDVATVAGEIGPGAEVATSGLPQLEQLLNGE